MINTATIPANTPSAAPIPGNLNPQIVPKRGKYMMNPKAVASPPNITKAAFEVKPTIRATAVINTANNLEVQICSA